MEVIHFPDDARPARWAQPILALGNFDGVHRGHRKILERVRRVAGERGATSVVMTFDPHPPRVVRPDKAPPLLMTIDQKLEAIVGRPPDMTTELAGCSFAARCKYAQPKCLVEEPRLLGIPGHQWRCHFPVGSPEGDHARQVNAAAGVTASGLQLREDLV